MKKQIWVAIGIFILIFGIVLIATNETRPTGEVIGEDQVSIDGEEPPVPGEEIPAHEPKIEEIIPSIIEAKIVSYSYSPTTIEINVGDTVVWENRDSVGHTITSDVGEELNSRLLSYGQKYSHTFLTSGEYSYYCKPHPFMRGKVIVR